MDLALCRGRNFPSRVEGGMGPEARESFVGVEADLSDQNSWQMLRALDQKQSGEDHGVNGAAFSDEGGSPRCIR